MCGRCKRDFIYDPGAEARMYPRETAEQAFREDLIGALHMVAHSLDDMVRDR